MTCRLTALALDAADPDRLALFWGTLLGRAGVADARGVLLPGPDTAPGLRFVPGRAARTGPNLVHLHLTSTSAADQQRTVETALAHGATHLDVGQLPEEEHVVLADPEGNEFCVIEPGNAYLAGCGRLGELACDGTRAVGLFWARALGWPLVWDQDEETAIQSPRGGTKVAWGGPPLTPRRGRNRQRFDLAVDPAALAGEVDRLVGLGATRRRDPGDGVVELADVDGAAFHLVALPGTTGVQAFQPPSENSS